MELTLNTGRCTCSNGFEKNVSWCYFRGFRQNLSPLDEPFFYLLQLSPRSWAYECNTPNLHRQNVRLSGSANSMRSKMEDTFTDTQTWLDWICTRRFLPQPIETISFAWSRIRLRTWQKVRKVSDCLPFYFCLRAVLSFNLLAVVWFLQTSFVRLKPPLRGILVELGNYPKFVRVFHGLEFKLFWEILLYVKLRLEFQTHSIWQYV